MASDDQTHLLPCKQRFMYVSSSLISLSIPSTHPFVYLVTYPSIYYEEEADGIRGPKG